MIAKGSETNPLRGYVTEGRVWISGLPFDGTACQAPISSSPLASLTTTAKVSRNPFDGGQLRREMFASHFSVIVRLHIDEEHVSQPQRTG